MKYIYALGRRKTATATVRLYEAEGKSVFNDKPLEELYKSEIDRAKLEKPFKAAELKPKNFHFTVKANGGGVNAQLEAAVLGIARAIVKMDPEKKPLLKKEGLLTRDPRMVERKKTGLHKARKAEQYSKR